MIGMKTIGDKKEVAKGTYTNNDNLIDMTFADTGTEPVYAQPIDAGGRDMWWLWSEYDVDVTDSEGNVTKERRTRELGAYTRWNDGEAFRPYTIPYSSGVGVTQKTKDHIGATLADWIK